ncbi:DUF3570 domain-containing protein [Methylomarinum sp. Ch1-1]|uniref:DUF3570 domain-containing protein n=1 Tax=Methylomarinum roseum TaxID=3067653 RepID=A0AAU7NVU4_9GAMM|nr:DUF3570 domain-containing protein [Methylomarinum sp. Ch1-1]MDP4522813.1 DUF3570 domain-containing protein [Methylomarinum sp. Ch1-1]
MAATKTNALHALTAAALALPGMSAKAAASDYQAKTDIQYGHYRESDDRISVDIYQGMTVLPISQSLELQGSWVIDSFSGATPVLTLPASVAQTSSGASGISGVDGDKTVSGGEQAVQVMTGASTRETRYGVDIGLSYFLDNLSFHASGKRSEEPDYLSHGYHVGVDWDFNRKLNTLSLGFGQNFDRVEPTTRPLSEEKNEYQIQLGLSQILGKKSLFRLSAGYTHGSGYLSNPYKKVFIQGLDTDHNLQDGGFNHVFYENRPDKRDQWSVSLGYIRYFSALDSALHLDYRYFTDSWDIASHTFEAVYHQPLAEDWMLIPRLRYYSQNQARFYRDFYTTPRKDHHYSSDFRLAGFGVLSGGIKLSREWRHANKLTESIKLEAGFEYSAHAAALQLGGQTASELTDFNYVLFSGAIKIKF